MLEETLISNVQQTSANNKNVLESRNRKYAVPTDLTKAIILPRLDRKYKHCAFRKHILYENTSIENKTLRSENISVRSYSDGRKRYFADSFK